MPRGTTLPTDLEREVSCAECQWRGIGAEARAAGQLPGPPHYGQCPDCGSNAVEPL